MRNLNKLQTALLAGCSCKDVTAVTLGTCATDYAVCTRLNRHALLCVVNLLSCRVPSIQICVLGVACVVLALTYVVVVTVLVLNQSPTVLNQVVFAKLIHLCAHIGVAILFLRCQGLLCSIENTLGSGQQYAE